MREAASNRRRPALRLGPAGARLVGITGTPGTGKKSVAPIVASLLGLPLHDINAIALEGKTREGREFEVDTALLRRRLARLTGGRGVVFGHLLPDVLRPGEPDLVAVLRCEPLALKARLAARGYDEAKTTQNLEAELIGVVLDASLRRFGPGAVREYDTTAASPATVARRIVGDMGGAPRARRAWTDWTLRYASPRRLRSLFPAGTWPAST